MGRRKGPLPPLEAEIVRQAFVIGDNSGVLIRRSTGADATFMGTSGALLVRCYHAGSIRRLMATRVAWVVASGEWPKGVVRVRDGDERNLQADNLLLTKRGPHPFVQSAGGKGSSLERRQAADRALLAALAEHQGALTVPQLSVSVGQSAPCCCMKLAKLETRGLVCGPHCNARKRWDLTPAGRALAAGKDAVAVPVILDDLDRRFLTALALAPMRLMALSRRAEVCPLTVRRRLDRLAGRRLIEIDEDRRFTITSTGRALLGEDAPTPWFDAARISAASARDVIGRASPDVLSLSQRGQLGGRASKGRQSRRPKGGAASPEYVEARQSA